MGGPSVMGLNYNESFRRPRHGVFASREQNTGTYFMGHWEEPWDLLLREPIRTNCAHSPWTREEHHPLLPRCKVIGRTCDLLGRVGVRMRIVSL